MIRSRHQIGNAPYINKMNKVKVLNVIQGRKAVSRADLAKITGLSAPTVTRLVDSLINNECLVIDNGPGDSTGGRPPNMVEFDSTNNFVIGIELSNNINGVLTDLDARIIASITIPSLRWEIAFEDVMLRISQVVNDLIANSGIHKERILGVGLATGGLVDKEKGVFEYAAAFDKSQVDFHRELGELVHLPMVIDNLTRVMSLGELWYGVGREYKNFIFVNVGDGIGAGIILNGQPFYGARGMSGEFGHITVERESTIRCHCGSYGCLTTCASGEYIARAACARMEAGERSEQLLTLAGGNPASITAELVAKAAKRGDEFSLSVMNRAADYLGMGLATLINLYNPEAIVLGGGVMQSGQFFMDAVKQATIKRGYHQLTERVAILPATHGLRATVMGAVGLVLHEILDLNLDFAPRPKMRVAEVSSAS